MRAAVRSAWAHGAPLALRPRVARLSTALQSELVQQPLQAGLLRHVEALIAPLARADDAEYIGEPISQLAHALQCADWAARKGAPGKRSLVTSHFFGSASSTIPTCLQIHFQAQER